MNINFRQSNINFEKGEVILGGAGPGSLKLISLKLKYVLQKADIIIFDALVNKELLHLSNKKAKLIYAGKLKKKKSCTQSQINQWLVNHAKNNKRVLRLKGGDISFFSRGSQEIEYLKKNNIPFRIFSGITSSQTSVKETVGSFFNSSGLCNLITGHKKINEDSKFDINYDFLRKTRGRIIIYMGVSQIKEIVSSLLDHGLTKNKEVSIVTNSSLKSQKIYSTKLNECPEFIKNNGITSPAIIIID